MKRIYYFLFLILRVKGKDKMGFYNAYLFFCFLQLLNVMSIISLFRPRTNSVVSDETATIISLMIFGILLLLNYFVLLKEKNKISEAYKDLSKKDKMVGFVITLFYIVLSFYLFFR